MSAGRIFNPGNASTAADAILNGIKSDQNRQGADAQRAATMSGVPSSGRTVLDQVQAQREQQQWQAANAKRAEAFAPGIASGRFPGPNQSSSAATMGTLLYQQALNTYFPRQT